MHYNLFTLPIEEEPVSGKNSWIDTGIDMVDSLLSWCEANEIWLILDLHAAPGGQGYDQGISDYDPTKPSLWESEFNRSKTVALWKKLAEKYKDEPWIGGYDLINETNWNMSNNAPLKSLYQEITDSIRVVDQNHIIFIEGNWFANDFTGLTPPWDSNMVYSFHKYWTHNDVASIQWMLSIRNNHNVPVWLGESGENSNTWFLECIRLMEENNIGWAWWPLKKIESISCPLSVKKSVGYQKILDYWNGDAAQPSTPEAKNGLMQLANNLKLENCDFRKDVVDALFRQIDQNSSVPYKHHQIPGVIHSTDFDMGANGVSYFDQNVANYHLSTDHYTAWNQGWNYRNDGVDIEISDDALYSNGFNVGWIEDGEWLKYSVWIDSTASYKITLRTAALGSDGRLRYLIDSASVTPVQQVSSTGDWKIWANHVIDDIILEKGWHSFTLMADKGGFNAGGFKFEISGASIDLPYNYLYSETDSEGHRIDVALNKSIYSHNPDLVNDFSIQADGVPQSIDRIEIGNPSGRMISIHLTDQVEKTDQVLVSYSGSSIVAEDGSQLQIFSNKLVHNKVIKMHLIPGKIEAEDFSFNQGLGTEVTSDVGGGLNIGWTDKGDLLEYNVTVLTSGIYNVTYRSSGQDQSGSATLFLLGSDSVQLHTLSFPVTQGWQSWENTSSTVVLTQGIYTLRLLVDRSGFNLNWFEFSKLSGIVDYGDQNYPVTLYPNPVKNTLHITGNEVISSINLYSIEGSFMNRAVSHDTSCIIDVSVINPGIYLLQVRFVSGYSTTPRFVKE